MMIKRWDEWGNCGDLKRDDENVPYVDYDDYAALRELCDELAYGIKKAHYYGSTTAKCLAKYEQFIKEHDNDND